jgi:hypothetical protein
LKRGIKGQKKRPSPPLTPPSNLFQSRADLTLFSVGLSGSQVIFPYFSATVRTVGYLLDIHIREALNPFLPVPKILNPYLIPTSAIS